MPPSRPKLKLRAPVRTGTALVLSFLLHVPLMPIVLVLGLLSRIDRAEEAAKHDYQANDVTISVELMTELPSRATPPKANTVEAEAQESADLPRAEGEGEGSKEAGDLGEAEAAGEIPATEGEGEEESLGTLEGEANVTMNLWVSSMREHTLAPTLRTMLGCGKLGATLQRARIEAFDDLDAAVFAGPRLDDPRQYTAALSHHLSPTRLRTSLARLTYPNGRWLDDSSVRIQAAGANRVVFERGPSLVLATPESVWTKLKSSARPMRIPPSKGRAFSLSLREPSMALRRLGLDLPTTLTRMRLDAYPQSGGGVELRIRIDDRDEATAAANARKVASEIDLAMRQLRQMGAVSKVLAPLVGMPSDVDFELPRLHFVAEGSSIVGRSSMKAAQVEAMLAKLTPFVCNTAPTGEEGKRSKAPRGASSVR